MAMASKCSVRDDWFRKKDPQGHLYAAWASRRSSTTVFCILCDCTISVEQKGLQALSQHALTIKHKDAVQVKLHPQQLVLAARPAPVLQHTADATAEQGGAPPTAMIQLSLRQSAEAARRAELIWAMKCVQSSYSAASCDGVVDIFRKMFGMDNVPKHMSLGRTKLSYLLTDALGPYFRTIMLEDAQSAVSFTLCFDETTNEKRVKELQVGLRFFSESRQEVVFHHLETFFIGRATADIVFKFLVKSIETEYLCLGKILMLSSDGPNVNKSILKMFCDKLKTDCDRGLLSIGFCNLHILHTGFERGLSVFGSDVSEIAILVYAFLDYPNRFEEYEKSQEQKNIPMHSLLKHVSSRWLTLGNAAERLQEQWPALKHYFLRVLPLKKGKDAEKTLASKCYLAIAGALKDDTFPAQIAFVIYSASLFERFSKVFQTQQPMIHVLYEEISDLFILLLSRFCKAEVLKTPAECMKEDFISDSKNYGDLKKVEIGKSAVNLLKDCTELQILKVCQEARNHYKAAASHVLNKSILSTGREAKHLRCLKPQEIKESRSLRSIVSVFKMMRLSIPGVNEDNLRDEWKLLQLEKLPEFRAGTRIDHFWRQIFDMKDFDGHPKYPSISKVVKGILPAAHGSADVERGFSESRIQLPADRSAMQERVLNARLNIRDGMKQFGGKADAVPITPALLKAAASAYSKYEEHLQVERQKEEEKRSKREEEERARQEREAEEAGQTKKKKELGELQKNLKKAKDKEEDERQAANKLIEDANLKLKKALSKGDIQGAKVAQGMLEGAQAMLNRANKVRLQESEPLRKQVEKRTSSLLEKLFKNHEKRRRDDDENPDDPDAVS